MELPMGTQKHESKHGYLMGFVSVPSCLGSFSEENGVRNQTTSRRAAWLLQCVSDRGLGDRPCEHRR